MKKKSIVAAATLSVLLSGCFFQSAGDKAAEQGEEYLKDGEYEDAISQFETAISADKSVESSYRGLGIAYLNLEEYDNAIEAFDEALSQSKGEVGTIEIDISYYKAVAQMKNDDFEGAISTYTNLIDYDGDNYEPYYLRGTAYLNMNDMESALADFSSAVKVDSDNYDLYINIYKTLKEEGDTDSGKEYLEKALDVLSSDKDGDQIELYTGRISFYLEDYETAIESLQKAISNGDDDAYLYLGQVYDQQNDTETAQENYEKYISKVNNTAEVYNSLGESLLQEENYTGALEMFQAGLELEDEDLDKMLRFNEIIAYEYLLDFETAKEKCEEYVSLYPDDENAEKELEFLETR